MTIFTLFFIFLAIAVVSSIAAVINFTILGNKLMNGDGFSTKGVSLHLLFGALSSISWLGVVLTGIVWLIKAFILAA